MGKPAVTVLMPTYNRAHFLAECLDSVLGQTIPPSQVIVVNDGSTDNTREVLQAYMGRIEYMEQENGGKSRALNLALPRARGEYIWIMDDDDVALPEALETHLKVLTVDATIGFTYTSAYLAKTGADGTGLEIVGVWLLPDIQDEDTFTAYLERYFFHQSTMLARASCYAAVGKFDVALIRSQDYEMNLRIARRFPARRINTPTILIRRHAGLRGSSVDRFPDKDKRLKWREYDRKFFRKLRGELDVSEYLPRRTEPSGQFDRRRAYLRRAIIMAARGLNDEMFEDLTVALAGPWTGSPLSDAERAMLSRAMDGTVHGDGLLAQPDIIRRIRTLCRSEVGREVRLGFGRGLYWRALNAWRQKDRRFAVEAALAAFRLLGIRGAARLFLRRGRLRVGSKPAPSGIH